MGDDALSSRQRHGRVQQAEEFRRPIEVLEPLAGVGVLARHEPVDRCWVDVVQLTQEPSQPVRSARGRAAAQQRPSRYQRVGQDAGILVGEARSGYRHRHTLVYDLEQAGFADHAPAGRDAQHQVLGDLGGVIEPVPELDDGDAGELRDVHPQRIHRALAPRAVHAGWAPEACVTCTMSRV